MRYVSNFQTIDTGSKEREYELIIKRCISQVVLCHLYPRLSIEIVIQVVHDDGGVLALSLTAAGLALIDAGIPMKDIITAIHSSVDCHGNIIVDPTLAEEKVCLYYD